MPRSGRPIELKDAQIAIFESVKGSGEPRPLTVAYAKEAIFLFKSRRVIGFGVSRFAHQGKNLSAKIKKSGLIFEITTRQIRSPSGFHARF